MHKSIAHTIALASIGIAFLSMAFSGCNTSGCLENQSSLPLAGMYSMSTKTAIGVRNLTVGGVGAPDSALLTTEGSATRQVYLPFRADKPSTSFFFTITDGELSVSDTITFTYSSEPFFASEECGAMFNYRILNVAHTGMFIDSIGITDSLITNLDIERISIYFHDSEEAAPEQ